MKSPKFEATGDGSQQAFQDIINNVTNNFNYIQKKLPSYLSQVIYYLDKSIGTNVNFEYPDKTLYEIEEKIKYNHVKKYAEIISEWGVYGAIIDDIYNTLDDEKPNSKEKFLLSINLTYKKILGNYISKNKGKSKSKILETFSDSIIDDVLSKLEVDIMKSEVTSELTIEDIQICLTVIVCKAFIDCKILEVPV